MAETHAEELAREAQAILIRAAVTKRRAIPPLPSAKELAVELMEVVARQRAEIRLELLMEVLSSKAAEVSRGMLLTAMAAEERRRIDQITKRLEGRRTRELEREGDDSNESFYPPRKP